MDEKQLIRELAKQVKEIAYSQRMKALRGEWKRHNCLEGTRPMICVSPEGSWRELIKESDLKCTTLENREMEYVLRQKIYWANELKDDTPIDNYFDIPWQVQFGNYGIEEQKDIVAERGSYNYKKLIEDIDKEFYKLKFRDISIDREATKGIKERTSDILGDILDVRVNGSLWWTLGMTSEVIKLIGLEELMLYMYDGPEALHKLMKFFMHEHLAMLNYLEEENVLSLNNGCNLIASGGIGLTDELPTNTSGLGARRKEMWGFAESQETVGISPQMFGEFIFPYQLKILEGFGLNCYGCCEPIENRWEYIKQIPRLRRISVSPWSNQEEMADLLGKNYIFSRKPNPSIVCIGFEEEAIRKDLEQTMKLARKINLEIILKDTHTVENRPDRLAEWVRIARKESIK